MIAYTDMKVIETPDLDHVLIVCPIQRSRINERVKSKCYGAVERACKLTE